MAKANPETTTECWRCRSTQDLQDNYCSDRQCSQFEEPAPLRFGSYKVVSRIGTGAHGAVYKCVHLDSAEFYAVKKLLASRERTERVNREARALQTISHPNVARLHDYDIRAGYLVMEYVDGISLRELLDDPARLRPLYFSIFRDVVDGLRAAHVGRCVHRDIKPENIMVTADGRGKLVDFGVARLIDAVGYARTRVGSWPYMASEVIYGTPYGLDVDLHSLGCVMYEAWTGVLPFPENANPNGLAIQKQHAEFVPISHSDAAVDPILESLVSALLATPERRLKSAEAALELLDRRDRVISQKRLAIDDLAARVTEIWGVRNQSLSPLVLHARFASAVRLFIGAVERREDPSSVQRLEAGILRAFLWLCSLASSQNATMSELVWLKFENVCPYCTLRPCGCVQAQQRGEPERNQKLLEECHGRRLAPAPPAESFEYYRSMFREIYGAKNLEAGESKVMLHVCSEIFEAGDALARINPVSEGQYAPMEVTKLYLELSDLTAWFFALLELAPRDFDFLGSFDQLLRNGCYVCSTCPCTCPTSTESLDLTVWRDYV